MALPVIGLAVACAAIAAVALINLGHAEQIQIDTGQTVEDRFGLQGTHHRINQQLVNAAGKVFIIDDIVVGKDKIAIRYHATGIAWIPFEELGQSGLYTTEPPTLIKVTTDGVKLLPADAHIGGENGSSTLHGEHVAVFTGSAPHHLQISVVRLQGDVDAVFATEVDL
jgi:hypothetical protein